MDEEFREGLYGCLGTIVISVTIVAMVWGFVGMGRALLNLWG